MTTMNRFIPFSKISCASISKLKSNPWFLTSTVKNCLKVWSKYGKPMWSTPRWWIAHLSTSIGIILGTTSCSLWAKNACLSSMITFFQRGRDISRQLCCKKSQETEAVKLSRKKWSKSVFKSSLIWDLWSPSLCAHQRMATFSGKVIEICLNMMLTSRLPFCRRRKRSRARLPQDGTRAAIAPSISLQSKSSSPMRKLMLTSGSSPRQSRKCLKLLRQSWSRRWPTWWAPKKQDAFTCSRKRT